MSATEKSKPAQAPVGAVAELQKGADAMAPNGAALLVAHAIVEIGEAKVRAWSPDQARAYAAEFRRRCHMAVTPLQTGSTARFVTACRMYGIACESADHYQAEVARLLPAPRIDGIPLPA